VFLDFTQSRGVIQVLRSANQKIGVVFKDTQSRIAPLTQDPTNVVGVMTVVDGELVLFELERVVTDGAIIPLNFQQKVIICGGQSEPIKPVYV